MNAVDRLVGRTRARVAATPGGVPALALLDRFLPGGAVLLSVLTFGAYGMGLVRDRIFARTFGAGPDLDVYNAALALPEIVLDILVTGGLQASFIPLFARLRDEDEDSARIFARTVLTGVTVVAIVAVVVLFVAAPATIDVLGLEFSSAQRALYVPLFRLMLVTMIVFAVSFALGELLVAQRRFLAYGAAPLLYNGGIALGALLLGGRYGVAGAAIGTVAGALAHLAIRVWAIRRERDVLRPLLAWRLPAIRDYIRLALPKSISQPVEQLTFLEFNALATRIGAGALSSLSFARNFASVPVSLIGVSFAVAAFPAISDAAARGDRRRFVAILMANAASITALTTAAAVVLLVGARAVVDVFLGGGAFGSADVARTSAALAAFGLSVPLESLTHLFSRGLYATRTTILPVAASVVGFVVTVGLAVVLVGPLAIAGLPIAFAAGSAAKVTLLVVFLGPRIRRLGRTLESAP